MNKPTSRAFKGEPQTNSALLRLLLWAVEGASLSVPKSPLELLISQLALCMEAFSQKTNHLPCKLSFFLQRQLKQNLSAGVQAVTMNYQCASEPI